MRRLLCLALLAAMFGIANAGGKEIYDLHCAICHQRTGKGVPGLYPSLADSIGNYVRIPQGRTYLVHVVTSGMSGPISAHGQSYNGVMQSWAQLSDEQIAEVLNHALSDFNRNELPKDFSPLTADEVKKARATKGGIGDNRKEREALLKALENSGASERKAPGS